MFRRRITGVYVSIITQALVLAFVTWLNGSQGLTSGTNGITDFQTFLGINLRGENVARGPLLGHAADSGRCVWPEPPCSCERISARC